MDDVLMGTTGDDVLSGDDGNDTYSIGLNEGHDVIDDDGLASDIDILCIYGGVMLTSLAQLEFTPSGSDLIVRGYGPGGVLVLDVIVSNMDSDAGRVEKLQLFSEGDQSDPRTLNLVQMWSAGQPESPATDSFVDDFNRSDGAVGNGWTDGPNNAGDLTISGNRLTESQAGGSGVVYRAVDFSGPVSVSFDVTELTGYAGFRYRYATELLFGSEGNDTTGLSLYVHRGDENYSDSRVQLAFNDIPIATISSNFQFMSSIHVTVTLGPGNAVSGSITSGEDQFDFDFGPQAVTLVGAYFAISQDGPDGRASPATYIFPTIDNFILSHPDDYAPSGVGTAGSLDRGESVSGVLEQPSDTDWFAIELAAGAASAFTLVGGTLADPYLELRDAAGALVDADDDAVAGQNDAALTFVAPTTGTYFLVVGGNRQTGGTYTLQAIEVTALGTGAFLDGSIGADTLIGSTSADTLNGAAGNDLLSGRSGDDALNGGDGADTLIGGAGIDTASYASAASAVTVNLATLTAQNTVGAGTDTLSGIENLLGSAYNDTLYGDGGANLIEGGAGSDYLDGVGGTDTVSYASAAAAVTVTLALATAQNTGGAGTDTVKNFENLTGSAYGDTLTGNSVINIISGGAGADSLYGGGNNDTLSGDDGADALDGGTGNDTLYGGAGADALVGGDGKDILDGGGGADTLDGGAGDDTYVVDDAGDMVTEGAGAGGDTVQAASAAYTLTANVENLTNIGSGAFTGTGNDLVNIITGAGGGDTLCGLDANDKLYGGEGADVLIGGVGGDLLTGGLGADAFVVQSLADSSGTGGDTVADFSHAEGDYIDLSAMDADSGLPGDQAFTFIGSGAFTHTAGELRYQVSGGLGILYGDVNGDGTADLIMKVNGGPALVAGDFHP